MMQTLHLQTESANAPETDQPNDILEQEVPVNLWLNLDDVWY